MIARRWLSLAVVAGLAAALALLGWWQFQGPASGGGVTALMPDQVHHLRVQRPNREDVLIRRGEAGWEIIEPARVGASAFHVRQLAQVASAPSQRRYARQDVAPGLAGLDPPRLRLEVNDQVLEFGGTDAVEGLRYVAVDDAVHLIRDEIMPLLEGGWWNFIDRHLAPSGWNLVEVEGEDYHLVRERGAWRDANRRLGAEQVSSLIADLRLATALVVREGQRRPDAPPALVLRFDNDRERRFIPVDSNGERRLKDIETGLLYVMDGAVRHYLLTGTPDHGS